MENTAYLEPVKIELGETTKRKEVYKFCLKGASKNFYSKESFYSFVDMLDLTKFYWWVEYRKE
jgi:capsid portal protein